MDKTLEAVTLVHRLIVAVALALFLVGISINRPNAVYDEAIGEIESLQDGMMAASDQVDAAYKAIYGKSGLRSSILAWLRRRSAVQRDIDIQVIGPDDLTVPNSDRNPLVTLDNQLNWANQIYRDLRFPFLLCEADHTRLFEALDGLFRSSGKPKIERVNVYIFHGAADNNRNRQFVCQIEVEYEVQTEMSMAVRRSLLVVPTTVADIEQVTVPGPGFIDLDVAGALKENGLGDWEDSEALVVSNIWELWPDLKGRPPTAAKAFLEEKKRQEAENSKEKIEILGESLSRGVTIIMASVVELSLMIYLLAHLLQVRRMLSGHKVAVSESPFYGIMRTKLGRFVMLLTFILPFGVCLFVLACVFPTLETEWIGLSWVPGWVTRWVLIASLGVVDLLLIVQARRTVVSLSSYW